MKAAYKNPVKELCSPLQLRVLKLRNYTVARGPVCGQKKRLPRKLSVRVVREGRMLRTVQS